MRVVYVCARWVAASVAQQQGMVGGIAAIAIPCLRQRLPPISWMVTNHYFCSARKSLICCNSAVMAIKNADN